MLLYRDNEIFQEYVYEDESEFENDIIDRSKLLFGRDSVMIDTKKKVEAKKPLEERFQMGFYLTFPTEKALSFISLKLNFTNTIFSNIFSRK